MFPQRSSKCYGCFDPTHLIRDCPKISNMLLNKVIILDEQFRYRFPDGQLIPRVYEESYVQTIERLRPPQNKVQFATIGDAVEHCYNYQAKRKYQQYEDTSEDETDYGHESDSEEDGYEEAHWSRRSQHRQQVTNYISYKAIDEEDNEPSYDAYPVEWRELHVKQGQML
jgi:hypothetical protein